MKCIVIGGGAAGLMAGCILAEAGVQVEILERQMRVGKKLLATGNGRCNFTNMGASPANYRGSAPHIASVLEKFSPEDVADAFEKMGVPAHVDDQGRAYPMSNMAASVLDALRLRFSECGGVETTDFDVTSISKKKSFTVTAKDGRKTTGDIVILCAGGIASPKLGGVDVKPVITPLGHKMTPRYPAITPIRTDTSPIRGLKGQKVRGEVTLKDGDRIIRTESGEVLFTEYGLSGICIMQLSGHMNGLKNPVIEIDMAPGMPESALFTRARNLEMRTMEDFLNGLVARRVGINVVKYAGINDLTLTSGDLSRKNLSAIYRALRHFALKAESLCGFDSAQVTLGGVDMRDVSPETLESTLVPGLYFAGEVCDAAGDCGGYNLHWAWASAMTAARAILEK